MQEGQDEAAPEEERSTGRERMQRIVLSSHEPAASRVDRELRRPSVAARDPDQMSGQRAGNGNGTGAQNARAGAWNTVHIRGRERLDGATVACCEASPSIVERFRASPAATAVGPISTRGTSHGEGFDHRPATLVESRLELTRLL